jgi:hypothetical protein
MTELKWTLFKDGIPDHDDIVFSLWITDFSRVSISTPHAKGYWETYAESFPDIAWAHIIFPEVPKKETVPHLCQKLNLKCFQRCDDLFVSLNGKVLFYAIFCPFCGFKPEKS